MALKISSVNIMALENSKAHRTHKYELVHLNPPTPVFRRGQEFEFDIIFENRPYKPDIDKLRVLFNYEDAKKTERKARGGAWVTNNQDIIDDMEMWSLRTISNEGNTLKLKMRTPVTCPIGCWKMTIKCDLRSHLAGETYDYPQPIYILLNPWHKDDVVYMPETHLLEEYVMNDVGKVYVGAKNNVTGRHWLFGQFEAHVLPIFRKILEESELDFHECGDPIELSRAICGRGLIVEGNWSGNFEDGTHPSLWTGSAPILKEYSETGKAVKYGQCWIFAAVGCTMCRAIGIPARVVSSIVAAIDYNRSLTIDKYFDKNGEFIHLRSESIWNFHACTDVWMARPDLPPGYGGWQFLDPTNSMGPGSLEAVKRGETGLKYNIPMKIGEVNADVVDWKADESALLGFRKVKTNTNYVGYQMLTKKPFIFDPNGERDRDDVMHLYKNPEGSKEERLALFKAAYKYSSMSAMVYELEKDAEVEEIKFALADVETVYIGKNFFIVLDMENTVKEKRNVQIALSVQTRYYNGVKAHTIKKSCDTVVIPPNSKEQYKIEVTADDYIGKLVDFSLLKTYIMATIKETKQIWSEEDDFQIMKPSLNIEVVGTLKVGNPGTIIFKLENPIKKELTECQLAFDCPGLVKFEKLPYRNVKPGEDVKIEVNITAKDQGNYNLVALFHSKELQDIMGSTMIEVSS